MLCQLELDLIPSLLATGLFYNISEKAKVMTKFAKKTPSSINNIFGIVFTKTLKHSIKKKIILKPYANIRYCK